MDYNISSWLKDELGLIHMSESDLNSLMFHPRHGTLCRRLVKFLSESTLCSQRFPTVYAEENYLEARETLENLYNDVQQAVNHLESYTRENEDKERELCFLKSKNDYLYEIVELQKQSTKALEDIAASPNLAIEQVSRNIAEANYLSNLDLELIYTDIDLLKLDTSVSIRQMTVIDEKLLALTRKVNLLHQIINKTLNSVLKKIEDPDNKLPSKRDTMITVQPIQFEEIELDLDHEERKSRENMKNLNQQLRDTQSEVEKLMEQYKTKKQEIDKRCKIKLERCLQFVDNFKTISS